MQDIAAISKNRLAALGALRAMIKRMDKANHKTRSLWLHMSFILGLFMFLMDLQWHFIWLVQLYLACIFYYISAKYLYIEQRLREKYNKVLYQNHDDRSMFNQNFYPYTQTGFWRCAFSFSLLIYPAFIMVNMLLLTWPFLH